MEDSKNQPIIDTDIGSVILRGKILPNQSGFHVNITDDDKSHNYEQYITSPSAIKSHKCKVCDKAFTTQFLLQLHQKHLHSTLKAYKFTCSDCSETFPDITSMKHHYKFHTEEEPLKCRVCGDTFVGKINLQCHEALTHIIENSDNWPFKCILCEKSFKTESLLRMHYFNIHHNNTLKRQICEKTFTNKMNLVHHEALTHKDNIDNRSFECMFCKKLFETESLLRMHYVNCKIDTELKDKYKCQICEKTFTNKMNLIHHKAIIHKDNTDNRSFKCKFCKKPFETESLLRMHYGYCKFDTMLKDKYKCQICEKNFASKINLKHHKAFIHKDNIDNRSFKCVFCKKPFETESLMRMHYDNYKIDTTLKDNYKCQICEKPFTNKINLVQHVALTHTDNSDNRRFMCTFCEKPFKTLRLLRIHYFNIHTKPDYQCKICEKIFTTNRKLQDHLVIVHRVENPLKCAVCGRTYIEKYYFQKHVNSHVRSNKSEVAQEGFTTRTNLQSHRKLNSNESNVKPNKNGRSRNTDGSPNTQEDIKYLPNVGAGSLNSVLELEQAVAENKLVIKEEIEIRDDFDIFMKQEEEIKRSAFEDTSSKRNQNVSTREDVEMRIQDEWQSEEEGFKEPTRENKEEGLD